MLRAQEITAQLLRDGLYSNVTVILNNIEFKAHKEIIKSSGYFASALDFNDKQYNQPNDVTIKVDLPKPHNNEQMAYYVMDYLYGIKTDDHFVENVAFLKDFMEVADFLLLSAGPDPQKILESIIQNLDDDDVIQVSYRRYSYYSNEYVYKVVVKDEVMERLDSERLTEPDRYNSCCGLHGMSECAQDYAIESIESYVKNKLGIDFRLNKFDAVIDVWDGYDGDSRLQKVIVGDYTIENYYQVEDDKSIVKIVFQQALEQLLDGLYHF